MGVQRAVLFVLAIAWGGLVVAGMVSLAKGASVGWLYLIAAIAALWLGVLAWRRLAARLRKERPSG